MKKKILALSLCVALLAIAIVGGTLAYFTDTTENVENTFTMGKVKITLDETEVEISDNVDEDGNYTMTVGTDRVTENDYTKVSIVPGRVFTKDPTIHVEKGSEESYIFLDMTFNKFSSLFWVMAADADADTSIAFELLDDDGALQAGFKGDNSDVFSTTKFIAHMVQNPAQFQAMINKWFTGIVHEDWELCDILVSQDGTDMTLRFAYKGDDDGNIYTVNTKDAAADLDIQFMQSFQMPTTVTQEMIENGTEVGGMQNNFNTTAANFKLTFTAYAIQAAEIGADANTDAENMAAAYKAMFNADKDSYLGG